MSVSKVNPNLCSHFIRVNLVLGSIVRSCKQAISPGLCSLINQGEKRKDRKQHLLMVDILLVLFTFKVALLDSNNL